MTFFQSQQYYEKLISKVEKKLSKNSALSNLCFVKMVSLFVQTNLKFI